MTLSDAFEAYRVNVIAYLNQSKRTEDQHKDTVRALIRQLGDIDIQDLTFVMVRDWKQAMDTKRYSPETIRAYLIKLRNVLRFLERQNITCLKVEEIPLPKRSQHVPTVISALDVQKLISVCLNARDRAIVSLLYSSGIRVSELTSLKISDVAEDVFIVRGKGDKTRPCFIDKRTRKLLSDYLATRTDTNPYLFIDFLRKKQLCVNTIQFLFRALRKRAGFDFPIHPHTLRHSFATNLMENGCHIYPLSRLLGHSSIQTTEVYLHIRDPELAEVYSRFHKT